MPHSDGTVSITVNGAHKRVNAGLSLAELATELGLVPEKVAVERNLEVVPRSTLKDVEVEDGDDIEIVHFVGGGDHQKPIADDSWTVAGRTFRSRLIVGTGKYKDFAQNAAALEASGVETPSRSTPRSPRSRWCPGVTSAGPSSTTSTIVSGSRPRSRKSAIVRAADSRPG